MARCTTENEAVSSAWRQPQQAQLQVRLSRRPGGPGSAPAWVGVHNLHVTLRFLGEITDAQMVRVVAAARTAAEAPVAASLTRHGFRFELCANAVRGWSRKNAGISTTHSEG